MTPPPTPAPKENPTDIVKRIKRKKLYKHLTPAQLILRKQEEINAIVSLASQEDEREYQRLKKKQEEETAAKAAQAAAKAAQAADSSSDSDIGGALTIAEQSMEWQNPAETVVPTISVSPDPSVLSVD